MDGGCTEERRKGASRVNIRNRERGRVGLGRFHGRICRIKKIILSLHRNSRAECDWKCG